MILAISSFIEIIFNFFDISVLWKINFHAMPLTAYMEWIQVKVETDDDRQANGILSSYVVVGRLESSSPIYSMLNSLMKQKRYKTSTVSFIKSVPFFGFK